MATRDIRARIAQETLAIVQGGAYRSPSGRDVSFLDDIQMAVHRTELITPNSAKSLRQRAERALAERSFRTTFEATNESTFSAAKRLVDRYGSEKVAALNFASAKNPGGGFLNGSQAQEESLARASALYSCLLQQSTYYDTNRKALNALYTDHMIVSPQVPVFRDDDDVLIDEPWKVTIITSPAPNAGAVAKNDPVYLPCVETTLRRRAEHILSAAVVYDQTALVLGAWGCGVFQNDPKLVAQIFREMLMGDGAFAKAFEHVTFAVLDRKGDNFTAFAETFGV
jgi:uncharacterized protein (TIGR02452 family)